MDNEKYEKQEIYRKFRYYNRTNTCPKVKEDNTICGNRLMPKIAFREKNKEGNLTGRWICKSCYSKDYDINNSDSRNNIVKSLRICRLGNQNPNHTNAKGNNFQELACRLYKWEDLNKKYNNYETPIDCYDPNTKLYHQVQGRLLTTLNGYTKGWPFTGFEDEYIKKFEDMVCFCASRDGNIIERIYIFPEKIVKNKSAAGIVKNSSRGAGWYEKYRIIDKDELKEANKIWRDII